MTLTKEDFLFIADAKGGKGVVRKDQIVSIATTIMGHPLRNSVTEVWTVIETPYGKIYTDDPVHEVVAQLWDKDKE